MKSREDGKNEDGSDQERKSLWNGFSVFYIFVTVCFLRKLTFMFYVAYHQSSLLQTIGIL